MPHFVNLDIKNGVITYTFSVAAASLAEFATFPLDLTKTRLQIQGEMAAKSAKVMPYRGMVKTCVGIVKEEGFFKLWSGITPAIWRHMIYSGSRMVLYEQLREKVFGKSADGTFKLWKSVCCGMMSGAMGQFLGNPADLVKVQMMMEGKRKLMGEKPRFKSATDALVVIWNQGKIRGLWKGAVPNVWRAALVNLGDLTTYDMAKERIIKHTGLPDNALAHFISSVCAGFAGAVCATPADVIKSRVMNQPTDEKGRGLIYKSTFDCLKTTIKNESIFSLYKGFLPVWIRLGPWSLIFWLSYERLRKLSGAEQF